MPPSKPNPARHALPRAATRRSTFQAQRRPVDPPARSNSLLNSCSHPTSPVRHLALNLRTGNCLGVIPSAHCWYRSAHWRLSPRG
eukprot:10245450-Alexandrium_andersonii.AAC.1